jgi:hypothetical protein
MIIASEELKNAAMAAYKTGKFTQRQLTDSASGAGLPSAGWVAFLFIAFKFDIIKIMRKSDLVDNPAVQPIQTRVDSKREQTTGNGRLIKPGKDRNSIA